MGDRITTSYCRRGQGNTACAWAESLTAFRRFSVAPTDFVLALSALLGSLLIPLAALYYMLRLKRRALASVAPPAAGRAK